MTQLLPELKPAQPNIVNIFLPYCHNNKRSLLPLALNLYQRGNLEGVRQIMGGDNIPFVAIWSVNNNILPTDLTRCRIQFDRNSEYSYEITIATSEFVNHLIELILNFQRDGIRDFSKSFYYRLLQAKQINR
ncbi:type IV pilus biogenesis protein EbsA [Aerosakkonemataceae cyanobacterium BLCC-F50]|uniref:Type IV pilus biogenesis protein EbsA n=1 Tax=Floridaenema flaviceps BLCC-F50 TaxID=3153642 RepID=A0ABV4XX69_9CYAN